MAFRTVMSLPSIVCLYISFKVYNIHSCYRKAKLLLHGTVHTVLPQRAGTRKLFAGTIFVCVCTSFWLHRTAWRSYSHAHLCPRNILNRCVSLRARASNWNLWFCAFRDFLLHSNKYFRVIRINKCCPFLVRLHLLW